MEDVAALPTFPARTARIDKKSLQIKPLRALATASASHAKTHMICNVPASEHCRASEIICLLKDANHRYPTVRPSGPATSFSGHLLYASVQHEIFALLRTCRQTGSSYFPFYFYGSIACAFGASEVRFNRPREAAPFWWALLQQPEGWKWRRGDHASPLFMIKEPNHEFLTFCSSHMKNLLTAGKLPRKQTELPESYAVFAGEFKSELWHRGSRQPSPPKRAHSQQGRSFSPKSPSWRPEFVTASAPGHEAIQQGPRAQS